MNRQVEPWRLPLGDLNGYAATDEMIQALANGLVEHYAIRCNCRDKIVGIQFPPLPGSTDKNWVSKRMAFLGTDPLSKALRTGNQCYAVSHSKFSNTLIFDVDNPELGDADAIAGGLRAQGWKFKQFNSGRGRHIWAFFNSLPRDLIGKYGGGPSAMRALGEAFLVHYASSIRGLVELRGVGNELIKLPGQFDPYYKRVILPFNDDGEEITDIKEAVDYIIHIERNNSTQLMHWIDQAWRAPWIKEAVEDKSAWISQPLIEKNPERSVRLDRYLAGLQVGPSESYIKMPNLVFQCLLSGVPESDVLQVIETFYNQGQLDGRVTCKDSISKWRSKAKSEIQRVYSHFNSHHALEAAHIISGDLEWICHNATKDIDRVFLGLHLWVSRASSKDTYFISRPQAMKWTEKWGMTDGLYRGALKRFNKMGLLKVAKNGHRGRPVKGKRLQATEFMLVGDPDRCGRPLGNLDLDSFLGLLCNQLSDSDVRLPDVALAA